MKKLFFCFSLLVYIACSAASPKQPRVFIADHDSWEASGGFVATKDYASGAYHEGIRRINTEQVKSLNKACPEITITASPESADYIVIWDTKTWGQTSWSGHQNEFAIYHPNGDLISSGAAHKISNAAKDICKAVSPKPQDRAQSPSAR